MYFCKSKKHVWKSKDDAQKCCNGYQRAVVFGNEIPSETNHIKVDAESGIRYARIWVKAVEAENLISVS